MPNNLLGMDNYYLDINGKSKHFGDNTEGLNEDNKGFGITGEKVDNGLVKMLMAGKYKNSFNNPTYYAGGGMAKRFSSGDYYADIGAMGGLMTGYEDKLSPMAALMLSLGNKDRARLNMLLAPPTDKTGALLMMNLGIPIK